MLWILLLVIFIGFIILVSRYSSSKFSLPPKDIETKPIKGLSNLSNHLEQSLDNHFMKYVEDRVRGNNKLKENEYEWRLLDLKRYFILTALLKETPMFSVKVDELWHEMLMFTREYDDFSKKYLGNTLHHSPNVTIDPDPTLRGFFDWVYSELFVIRDENILLYKGFFRHPVAPDVIEKFRTLPENELIDLYFKQTTNSAEIVSALVSNMKDTALKVKDEKKDAIREMMKKWKAQKDYNAMIGAFLSISYFHYDEFTSYFKVSSDSSASCTSCGTGHICSNGSDSSCSSCGGGGD